jgi:hypothetical protein
MMASVGESTSTNLGGNDSDAEMCPICLEPFDDDSDVPARSFEDDDDVSGESTLGGQLREVPAMVLRPECGHALHVACCADLTGFACPICRRTIESALPAPLRDRVAANARQREAELRREEAEYFAGGEGEIDLQALLDQAMHSIGGAFGGAYEVGSGGALPSFAIPVAFPATAGGLARVEARRRAMRGTIISIALGRDPAATASARDEIIAALRVIRQFGGGVDVARVRCDPDAGWRQGELFRTLVSEAFKRTGR